MRHYRIAEEKDGFGIRFFIEKKIMLFFLIPIWVRLLENDGTNSFKGFATKDWAEEHIEKLLSDKKTIYHDFQ
jgi:hypothetical protein